MSATLQMFTSARRMAARPAGSRRGWSFTLPARAGIAALGLGHHPVFGEDGNRLMSAPVSAMITSMLLRSSPGTSASSLAADW